MTVPVDGLKTLSLMLASIARLQMTAIYAYMMCSSAYFSTNETSYQRMCGGTRGYQKGLVNGFYSYSHSSQTIEGYYVERLSITYGHLLAGMNQYCESGGTEIHNSFAYYFDDPLWDRSNCIASYCCNTPNQPWFYTELSDATKNAIEAIEYVCGINIFRSGNSLVDQPELYIQ